MPHLCFYRGAGEMEKNEQDVLRRPQGGISRQLHLRLQTGLKVHAPLRLPSGSCRRRENSATTVDWSAAPTAQVTERVPRHPPPAPPGTVQPLGSKGLLTS
ncbi:hypothetical protein Celaphus_00002468, partial [Cervus elaphus hippelaphus]